MMERIMEINTKGGVVKVNLDDQEEFNKAIESICGLLDSIPDLIAAGVNSFIDANEAIRPEENVFVDLWPEYGSEDFEVKEPALIVTLRPISEADDFVNIQFPLWDIIKKAVIKEDRIGIAAGELRKMADYIDENTKKVKGA